MKVQVVNTTNTPLSRQYDFGIHAHGCRDVARAVRQGCTVDHEWEVANAEEAVEWNIQDMEASGFDRESAEMFTVRVFPCCGGAH